MLAALLLLLNLLSLIAQPHYVVQFNIRPIHNHNFTSAITQFLTEQNITIKEINVKSIS